ncbi:hypothetical protein AKJ09_02573 [Labilithrix luteola]|uniref:Uncharacterized protein n=1 Tax=Labilithrix luteola TaxID=1391654 RepID=A0A0K1PS06_9BACT|nr:hypothetical protein [Labilithrix luteola]AKU95909.1 hypothetical protein AKJ09_02573 [Labilithrix luteola]
MDSPRIAARPDVSIATTAPRVTPTPPRTQFKEVLSQSVVRGAETAMRVLPGSPLMAVALRGAGGPVGSLGVPMTGTGSAVRSATPEGPVALGSGLGGAVPSVGSSALAAATGTTGSGSGAVGATGTGDASIEASLQQSQDMNLYYLQIQEAVNAQNRTFSALSNVLKAEHDTVKTAIGNIR